MGLRVNLALARLPRDLGHTDMRSDDSLDEQISKPAARPAPEGMQQA
jgi:hypothetical protein